MLTKEETTIVFDFFREEAHEFAGEREPITITTMKKLLEDAIDHIKAPRVLTMQTVLSRDDTHSLPPSRWLPEVDILEDPSIWICMDEGCNSNCHGIEWARNAEDKLSKIPVSVLGNEQFSWIHKGEKRYTGIGTVRVSALGRDNFHALAGSLRAGRFYQ